MISEPEVRVTAESIDPVYDKPFIEVDEERRRSSQSGLEHSPEQLIFQLEIMS